MWQLYMFCTRKICVCNTTDVGSASVDNFLHIIVTSQQKESKWIIENIRSGEIKLVFGSESVTFAGDVLLRKFEKSAKQMYPRFCGSASWMKACACFTSELPKKSRILPALMQPEPSLSNAWKADLKEWSSISIILPTIAAKKS